MRTLCLLLLFSVVLFKATGQPGSLDTTFGNNGIQTTAILNNANILNEQGVVVLTNANGDIFMIIQTGDSTRVTKYLPGGRLDSSYGNTGYSKAANLNVAGAAFQGDKILVAGNTVNYPSDFALARYSADGKLDSTFGVNGLVTTDFNNSSDIGNAIALQGDKIVVAGYILNPVSFNYDFALARYSADGALDSSFGVNGLVTSDFNNSSDIANAIALQGDKIIAAGYTFNSANFTNDFALTRYTAEGRLDSTFGVNGLVVTDFNNTSDIVNAIALQGDKILAVGDGLARYTANGILDSSFGENGKITTGF